MKNNSTKKPKATIKADENRRHCTEPDCKGKPFNTGYCRLHYIANWKLLRLSDHLKAEKRLNAYVEKLAAKYPNDWMDKIKEGVEDEAKFRQSAQELEVEVQIDEPDTDNEFLEKFMRVVKPGGG